MNVIFFSNTNFLKKNQNSFYFIVVTKNKKNPKTNKTVGDSYQQEKFSKSKNICHTKITLYSCLTLTS